MARGIPTAGRHRDFTGRYVDCRGYAHVHVPHHPGVALRSPCHRGWYAEHRYVVEVHLGRLLSRDEHVHHINEVRDDNRIENLAVVSKEEHSRIHDKAAAMRAARR